MELVNVYKNRSAPRMLYRLLQERDPSVNISHRKMPTWKAHCRFFESKPYRCWYLIKDETFIGACYITRLNEIGIHLFKAHPGYEAEAIMALLKKHKPLKAIPGRRAAGFLANISPKNKRLIRLFKTLGFVEKQVTLQL